MGEKIKFETDSGTITVWEERIGYSFKGKSGTTHTCTGRNKMFAGHSLFRRLKRYYGQALAFKVTDEFFPL